MKKTERICNRINQAINDFLREKITSIRDQKINLIAPETVGKLEFWTDGDHHEIEFRPANPQITSKEMERFIYNVYVEDPEKRGVDYNKNNNGEAMTIFYTVTVKIKYKWVDGEIWQWEGGEIGDIVAEVEESTEITAHGQIPAIRGTGKIDFFPAAITEADFQEMASIWEK